jgi:hypothetical protein
MPKYSFEFRMLLPLETTDDFITGYLSLYEEDNDVPLLKIRASSGQRGHQWMDNYWERGKSPIPETSIIEGEYEVDTNYSTPPPKMAAAMGSRYYHITPDPIVKWLEKQFVRSEVGLHFDANYNYSPGSAGCIVIQPRTPEDIAAGRPGQKALNDKMDSFAKDGIKTVPLVVIYEERI